MVVVVEVVVVEVVVAGVVVVGVVVVVVVVVGFAGACVAGCGTTSVVVVVIAPASVGAGPVAPAAGRVHAPHSIATATIAQLARPFMCRQRYRRAVGEARHVGMMVPAFITPRGSKARFRVSSIGNEVPYSSRTHFDRALPIPWWCTIEPPWRSVSSQMMSMIGK